MFWETVAAAMLVVSTFPVWIFISILWGLGCAAYALLSSFLTLLHANGFEISALWIIPLDSIVQGFKAALSIPSKIWDWAKYDHPWWSIAIALVFFSQWGRGSNGN